MDKWKKALIALNNQINSKELDAAVKADNFSGEFEPSDEGITDLINQTKGLFNVESAINNPEIIEKINKENYPKHMKSFMNKFEGDLKPVLDKLGIDYSDKEFISDSVKDLSEALDRAISNGDSTKVVDSLKEDLAKAHKLLEGKDVETEKKINELKEEYTQKELYKTFKLKAKDFNWADVYKDPELQESLLNSKWEKLKAKAHLKLVEGGEIGVFQKDMPDKELYEGNNIATFQSLLEPEIEKYLKKSNPIKEGKSRVEQPQKDLSPREQANIAEHAAMKKRFAESMR